MEILGSTQQDQEDGEKTADFAPTMSSRCEVCRKAFSSRFAKYRHKKRFAKGTKCNIRSALGRPKRQKIEAAEENSEDVSHIAPLSPMLDNNAWKNIATTRRREIKYLNKVFSML